MNSEKCIMVVGAHAGDAEIMGGATVLKHVQAGWKAVLVHLTMGEKGNPKMSADEYAAHKTEEAKLAASKLGAECVILPYKDGELPVNDEVQWHIADAIRKYRPQVVLTHWKGSLHNDHINTHVNVMESLFFAGIPAFEREYPAHYPSHIYFAENWEDEEEFVPELYVDVDDVFDQYMDAVSSYGLFRGDIVRFKYLQWYRGAAEMRGAEGGFSRAVALMQPRTYYGRRKPVQGLLG